MHLWLVRFFVLGVVLSVWMPGVAVSQSAPYAQTQAASVITASNATLNGMATANGNPSLSWFEWGTNNTYGQQTPATVIGSSYGVTAVNATVGGLNMGGIYQCRLVVSNAAGITRGLGQAFTTGSKVALWPNTATNWPAGLTNATAIAGCSSHYLAVRNDGTIAAWGSNTYGESSVPAGITNAIAVSCGLQHSVALKADGTIVSWGDNSLGQTNPPAGLSNVVAIATGNGHNLALCNDGTVVAWGENDYGQATVPAGLSNVVAVACGATLSLVLLNDGTVTGWGNNGDNALSSTTGLTNVVGIAAGDQLTVALQADGTVWAFGFFDIFIGWVGVNYIGTLTGPGNTLAVAVQHGWQAADVIWLGSDGTVSNSPATTVPPGLGNVVEISAGWLALAPNVPPQTASQTIFGLPNADLPVTLAASDVNGDPLVLRITSLPTAGALYQYDNGARGAAIALTNTVVSDPGWRVIFAPATNGFGSPYDTFSYVTNDGQVDSSAGKVTINLGGVPYAFTRPAMKIHPTDVCLSGTATPNGLPASAWWEWGLTSNYGQSTQPISTGSATTVTLVSAGISNLTAGAIYHCRLVVSNAIGVAYGAEKLFTTGRNVTQFQSSLVPGLSNLVAIAGGGNHSLGLRNDETVVAWGSNGSGQTNVPAELNNVVQVAGGGSFSLALLDDGSVVGWGDHSQNEIPYQLNGVSDLAGGAYHTLALLTNGTVVGYGAYSQNLGQVTPPTGLSNVVAISAGVYHSLALKNDGTVVAWGNNNYGQAGVPSGLSNVVAIAAGSYHSLALKSDGTMVTWGTLYDSIHGYYSTMPLPTGLGNVVEIAAGDGFNLGMDSAGNVAGGATVSGYYLGITVPGNMTAAAHLAANSSDGLAIADLPPSAVSSSATGPANRDIVATLSGTDGNLDMLSMRIITQPATGQLYQYNAGVRGAPITQTNTIVTDPQGQLIFAPATNCFGTFSFNYVANDGWTDSAPATVTLTITATDQAVTGLPILLSASNAVLNGWGAGGGLPATAWFEWGTNSSFGQILSAGNLDTTVTGAPLSVSLNTLAPGGEYHFRLVVSNAAMVAYGAEKVFTTGRQVLAWGVNSFGQVNVPPALTNAVAVAGGDAHSLALSGDGTVIGWGRNDAGQASPPPGLTNAVAVAAGAEHSLALLADGSLLAWGSNNYGQTNVPSGLSGFIAIAAGANHNLALNAAGTVVSWGLNTSGQANTPAGLSNVVAVSAGWSHSLALIYNGTLAGWGSQTPPATVSNVTAIASAGNHNLALLSNGTVTAWGGANSFGENSVPAGLSNVVAIAAGTNNSVAFLHNGTMLYWGRNDLGQSSLPPGIGSCLELSAGSQHTLALGTSTSLPYAATEPPSQISSTNTLLRGMASANDVGATSWFEWGTNSLLGQTTTPVAVAGGENANYLATSLTGLMPYTAYCCRLVVSNALGYTKGRTVYFTTGGKVCAWGTASCGQTNIPPTLVGVVGISASYSDALALLNDGTVRAWGTNTYGQITVPPGATNIIAVAAGGMHNLALNAAGQVIAWGRNLEGQTNVPATLNNVLAIAAGDRHSLALRTDGGVVAWGYNGFGQTNVPAWLTNVVAIAAYGNGSVALQQNGIAIVWGNPASLPANLNLITTIGAGTNNDIFLEQNGTVVVVGSNASGQTNVPATLTNAIDVAVGDLHGAALKSDRTVTAWMGYYYGYNYGVTNVPTNLTNVVSLSVANLYNLALSAGTLPPHAITLPPTPTGPTSVTFNGAAILNDLSALAWFQWGTNGTFAQATAPVILRSTNYTVLVNSMVNALVPGGIYSCRLVVSNTLGSSYGQEQRFTTGRKMLAWGNNSSGQTNLPAGLTNVVAATSGQSHSAALLNNGTVCVWGANNYGQTNVPASATNVIAIASGLNHLLALRGDHTVVAWGANNYGQTNVPAAATNVQAIACGEYHSLALRADGQVFAWGNNGNGQINVPASLTDVVGIAGGGRHTLVLKSDGTVWARGDNSSGQTNVPAAASNIVAVAAGDSFSLGLRNDSTLVSWGSLNTSSGNNNLIAVAAGSYHAIALKTNGTLVAWGNNNYGQCLVSAVTGSGVSPAAGQYDSLIVGPNMPPTIMTQTVIGAANSDLVITPSGSDANGDVLNFRIASVPSVGALYQYTAGGPGAAITTPNTPATDSFGRVIFAPQTGASGWPYTAFNFIANDGDADSLPAATTVNIVVAPVLQPTTVNAWSNGVFSLSFSSDPNASYSVWLSTNLVNWSVLGAANQTGLGLFHFTDNSATNASTRFYRVSCP
jgi:alpha-tubulin suppressor-like RCC1 family protein